MAREIKGVWRYCPVEDGYIFKSECGICGCEFLKKGDCTYTEEEEVDLDENQQVGYTKFSQP